MSLVRALRMVVGDAAAVLKGERRYGYYYPAVSSADAILALIHALGHFLGLATARSARAAFAADLTRYYGGGTAFLYGSARSGLCDHLRALELPRGSEVAITGYTCEVVANAVIQAGLTPAYVDIDPDTYCMDPAALLRTLSARTRVLVIQHTYGIPAALDELLVIARDRGLYVIEDCAAALGSTTAGRPLGSFGDATVVSFELSKTITSGRGGVLLVRDRGDILHRQMERYGAVPEPSRTTGAATLVQLALSALLHRPRVYPLGRYVLGLAFKLGAFRFSTSELERSAGRGGDYFLRLTEGQAAIARRQWRRLPAIVAHARKVAAAYAAALGRAPAGALEDGVCLIRFPVECDDRDVFAAALNAEGVEPGGWFSAPLSSPAVAHELFGYSAGTCPVAERVGSRICNLPTHVRIDGVALARVLPLLTAVSSSAGDKESSRIEDVRRTAGRGAARCSPAVDGSRRH